MKYSHIKRSLACLMSAVVFCCVLSGCGGKKNVGKGITGMDVWTTDALTDVFMDSVMPKKAPKEIQIHLAKNEREGASLAYANKRGMAKEMKISLEPFTEPDAPVIQTYITHYSEVTKNSGYITPKYKRFDGNTMVPSYYVEGKSVGDVEPFVSGTFWIEAVSAKDTKPGEYKTKATLSSSKGEFEVPVTITVYDVTIPDPADADFSYSCWGDIGFHYASNMGTMYDMIFDVRYFDDNYWELQKNFAIAQKNERQNVCVIPLSSTLREGLQIDDAGNYTFDFTTFNKYVNIYLENGSYKYLCGSHLLDKDWYLTPMDGFPTHATVAWIYEKQTNGDIITKWVFTDSPEATRHLTQLLTALNENLVANGWQDLWAQHVCDEAGGEKQTEEILATYKLVHQLIPTAKTVDAGGNMYSRYRAELNFPTPQLDDYDARREEYRRANAEDPAVDVWFYTCTNPQRSFMSRLDDFSLLSTRALGWYAYKENVKGYLHWAWNLWYNYRPWDNIDHAGGPLDGWLVFPDVENKGVYEGPRSVATRDAFEDREILALAAEKDSEKVTKTLDELIEWGNKFDRDPQKYLKERIAFLKLAAGK